MAATLLLSLGIASSVHLESVSPSTMSSATQASDPSAEASDEEAPMYASPASGTLGSIAICVVGAFLALMLRRFLIPRPGRRGPERAPMARQNSLRFVSVAGSHLRSLSLVQLQLSRT